MKYFVFVFALIIGVVAGGVGFRTTCPPEPLNTVSECPLCPVCQSPEPCPECPECKETLIHKSSIQMGEGQTIIYAVDTKTGKVKFKNHTDYNGAKELFRLKTGNRHKTADELLEFLKNIDLPHDPNEPRL